MRVLISFGWNFVEMLKFTWSSFDFWSTDTIGRGFELILTWIWVQIPRSISEVTSGFTNWVSYSLIYFSVFFLRLSYVIDLSSCVFFWFFRCILINPGEIYKFIGTYEIRFPIGRSEFPSNFGYWSSEMSPFYWRISTGKVWKVKQS